MLKYINQFLSRIKLLFEKQGSKLMLSIGVGGFLSLYIISSCRVKLIPVLNETEDLYQILIKNNITDINMIEIYILMISIIAIIYSVLSTKKGSNGIYELMMFFILLLVDLICFMSIIIHRNISNLFILINTIVSIYLVWIVIGMIKNMYSSIRIDK